MYSSAGPSRMPMRTGAIAGQDREPEPAAGPCSVGGDSRSSTSHARGAPSASAEHAASTQPRMRFGADRGGPETGPEDRNDRDSGSAGPDCAPPREPVATAGLS